LAALNPSENRNELIGESPMKEIEAVALFSDEAGCSSFFGLSDKGEEPSLNILKDQLPDVHPFFLRDDRLRARHLPP